MTAVSLDAIPRTLSRAQSMDVLSSQANVGGYRAVLMARRGYGRYFPLLTTAAGTARPANVLVLGIGVAGLQAIATARRLGAIVKAYDVRTETKEQAESLGAQFIVLKSVADAAGEGGYARQLTPEEQAAQQQELNGHIGNMDVVITTAQVPGRRPPLLVTAEAVKGMKPGSVIVDMAASALGGNVELSKPDETVVTDNGVTILAPTNLPATMPAGASQFYARNLSAFLLHFMKDGQLNYRPGRRDRRGHGHHAATARSCRRQRRSSSHRLPRRQPSESQSCSTRWPSSCSRSSSASRSSARFRPRCTRRSCPAPTRSTASSWSARCSSPPAADNPLSYAAGLRGHGLRRGQRGRRLRRHRPHAADVPHAASRPSPRRTSTEARRK